MINIQKNEKTIEIKGIPVDGFNFKTLEDAHIQFQNCFSKSINNINIDLKDIDPNNHSAITFLICCGDISSKIKVMFHFTNSTKLMTETLKKSGFESNGSFKPKSYKMTAPQGTFESLGGGAIKFCNDFKKLIGFTGETFIALLYLIRHPKKIKLQEILFYMDKSGANAVPIVMLICFLIGVILAFQGIQQMAKFGLDIYVADLVSLSIVRELGPLMIGMICIGRAGSAYAAELGTMKVAEEIDAMNTMGLKPARFLVVPKIIALLIVMPMLVVLGDIAGIAGGVLIGISMSSVTLIEYTNRTLSAVSPANILESLVKGCAFAFIIAAVGCFRGFEAENNAKGVGEATTSSVVTGIFLLVLLDFFITFTYPQVLMLFGVTY